MHNGKADLYPVHSRALVPYGEGKKKGRSYMSAISRNNTTSPRLRLLTNHIPRCSKRHPGFNELNRLFQTLAARFHDPNAVRVRERFITNVVRLVQVTMETAVVQRHVDVDDVTVD